MALITIADSQTGKLITVIQDDDGLDNLSTNNLVSANYIPDNSGPTGTAIIEGRYIVCNDFQTIP